MRGECRTSPAAIPCHRVPPVFRISAQRTYLKRTDNVWVNVGYPRVNIWKGPYRVGDTSGYLLPTTTRLQWRNNQGSYEYATLPAGTRYIRVQRGSGRALCFHCYR